MSSRRRRSPQDSNQGNIARAQVNVSQTQIDLAGAERRVANEVQRAVAEYAASRTVVQRYEQDILPAGRRLRDEKFRLYSRGQEGLGAYLEVQREYNEVVRQYLETLVRHRRNMLRLNTALQPAGTSSRRKARTRAEETRPSNLRR